jgi:hypothetical protein
MISFFLHDVLTECKFNLWIPPVSTFYHIRREKLSYNFCVFSQVGSFSD